MCELYPTLLPVSTSFTILIFSRSLILPGDLKCLVLNYKLLFEDHVSLGNHVS